MLTISINFVFHELYFFSWISFWNDLQVKNHTFLPLLWTWITWFFMWSFLEKYLPQISQQKVLCPPSWTDFTWQRKLLASPNLWPHCSQKWVLTPSWTLKMCFFNIFTFESTLPQELHSWGVSKWFLNSFLSENDWGQESHCWISSLDPWITEICEFRCSFRENALPHNEHWKSFRPSWICKCERYKKCN